MTEMRNHNHVARFNRWSSWYEGTTIQMVPCDRVHREVLELIAAHSGPGGPESLLDIGCGTGRLLRRAGARWPGARLVGVDPAEGMVTVARRLTPAATFHVGFAEALPLAAGEVDAVASTVSFHHWNDQAAGVRDAARVLRPGGCLVLADIYMPGFLARINHHFRPNDPAVVRAYLAGAGLRVLAQPHVMMGFALLTVGVKG
jgi:ubiquinone/menaquinone biosynthesis C-methylase UbiE